MAHQYVPGVSKELIKHLRESRRDWQDKLPDADWEMAQIQRAIGANEVLRYLEELHERQMGLISEHE